MLWTLTSVAKTIPCNYQVKPIDFNCNPVPGSTVTDYHWNLSLMYEQEVERLAGMPYEKVARATQQMLDGEGANIGSFSPLDLALTTILDKEITPPTQAEVKDRWGAVEETTLDEVADLIIPEGLDTSSD
jgi:hypothetical protein